jgi:hypothetical protein
MEEVPIFNKRVVGHDVIGKKVESVNVGSCHIRDGRILLIPKDTPHHNSIRICEHLKPYQRRIQLERLETAPKGCSVNHQKIPVLCTLHVDGSLMT